MVRVCRLSVLDSAMTDDLRCNLNVDFGHSVNAKTVVVKVVASKDPVLVNYHNVLRNNNLERCPSG